MTTNKLYVGNLPFSINEDGLSQTFEKCGSVSSVKIITDRDTGRSKGFGFVEMGSPEEAQKSIDELDGSDVEGRNIKVSFAKEQERRPGGGRGNFNRSGGGNRY